MAPVRAAASRRPWRPTADQSEPAEPTEPTEPTDQSKPVEPVEPVESTRAVARGWYHRAVLASRMSLALSLTLTLAAACSSGNVNPAPGVRGETQDDTAAVDAGAAQPRPSPASSEARELPEGLRVLVTGFNDWRELGEPPNVWRCRDNPSCRLLVGDERSGGDEMAWEGPLVDRLRAAAPGVEWRFSTLPVTWGVFAEVPRDVDVIVNIGLGIYDRTDALQLEAGAFDLRAGADALGEERPGPIGLPPGISGEVLPAPEGSAIPGQIDALAGETLAGYEILVAQARRENTYLCNETHFNALAAVHEADPGQRLGEVYFLHIPYAEQGDYDSLAAGVAEVVLGLLSQPESGRGGGPAGAAIAGSL
ncbi:hypothetical protein G6O69_31960 [Pseudenhygromyxa sp. WMMC2535]|uniref:hypothetical protein n=1 Tax=Pseudenhygromyxa sp. WMMC2535 TaxID=2712867 RepID=UPI00159506C1|nr:hypothetical protein [Pseudenhygromyxa sp. WMMC2535]NVB42483.1 hypothetical protein [Pseudenhygromyxa sp. WMMC2535]